MEALRVSSCFLEAIVDGREPAPTNTPPLGFIPPIGSGTSSAYPGRNPEYQKGIRPM